MKVNLKKLGAIVAGATVLASSAAFASLMFGSTTLVNDNGAPEAKVVVGSNAHPMDGVAAALIASKMASETYKSQTLTAQVTGAAKCTASGVNGTAGTCAISDEKVRLEITIPGSAAAGTYTFGNLIGDYVNRDIGDREPNDDTVSPVDPDQGYPMGGSDTADNANPFTDGDGNSIGPTQEFMYRISGTEFSPFGNPSPTLTDDTSGNKYVELQHLWVSGYNKFDDDADDVVAYADFLAYTLKFNGPSSDDSGIPVCTKGEDTNYAACFDDVGDTTMDDATETHRLKVQFLGEQWIVSEMNAPTASLTNENDLVNGGSIKLAKEATGGILNQGESLPIDDLKFQLDDLEAHGETTSAILSILDANGAVLKKDKVEPGQTKEFIVGGKTYRFHVYKVAPGYTFGAKWADVAIFAKELELIDGDELNADEGDNDGYQVALGWKNVDGTITEDDPDALRTVVIYSDSIPDMSSTEEDMLEVGDYLPIVEDPVAWKLTYKGLDLKTEDRDNLKFKIEHSDTTISDSHGPDYDNDGILDYCDVYAPYIKVTSSAAGGVFETTRDDDGSGDTLTNKEFLIMGGNGADCYDDSPGATGSAALGDVFMKMSSSTNADYGVHSYDTDGTEILYDDIGDGDTDFSAGEGGAILLETEGEVDDCAADTNLGLLLSSDPSGLRCAADTGTPADMYFAVAEKAGEGESDDFVDYLIFGVADFSDADDATFDFASSDGTQDITSDNEEILYGHAISDATNYYGSTIPSGPVDEDLGMQDEGYITERGSVFKSLDDDVIQFDMANTLAHAEWFLAPTTTNATSAETRVETMAEGESKTISGVTIKVLEITEKVGACSAAGGAASCTADTSGQSAVIMPNNAATVAVAMPYTGSYGSLVILDSDAVGVNTLVSVGGDKVNTVTKDILQSSAVDWTAETKVVKEVVQGQKIVVAGKEKEDTLAAAQDFVAQLKKV